MSHVRTPASLLALAFMISTTGGCQESTGPDPLAHGNHESMAASRVGVGQLDDALAGDVRQATARFSATEQATKEGYAEASACVAVPGVGGMGFHWVANGLVDPVFDALQPEAVLYEPQKNGQLQLVAVEYIVVNIGQPAPTFGGQPFDVGGTPLPVPHWSLHVWVHRENPNGLFTPFNPNVSCS